MSKRAARVGLVLVASAGIALGPAPGRSTATQQTGEAQFSDLLPLQDFSPTILGIYRKLMQIEDQIRSYSDKYDIDYDLTRATCMYESGGNDNLTSWAGAHGYFQVMPSTFRSLHVATNIEAGIKYLSQLVHRFEREDYALAAYNGGPANVGRGRAMRLESLQYVLGVGNYRTMLKLYERSIRFHASQLQLTEVRDNEDWWLLSRRLGLSLLQLRMHNPYLARRQLRKGQLIAYPAASREDLFHVVGADLVYTTRLGDNYFNVAFTLDVDLDELRGKNELWHLQPLPVGMTLHLPLAWEGEHVVHEVQPGETIEGIARELDSEPWRIVRDNALFWQDDLTAGMTLRVRPVPKRPIFLTHRVSRGENLTMIARRYGTTVASIQVANRMGRRTMIKIGERLRIPTLAE